MKYIINTDDLYGGDIYKSILLMGTNGKGEVIVQKFNLDELEELTADYINEHFGQLQDDAYKRGFEDGKEVIHKGCEGCKYEGRDEFTAPCKYCANRCKNHWTTKQTDDEIKVGDEVVWTEDEDVVIIVTLIYTSSGIEWCDGICRDGKVYQILTEHARKTSRHFDIGKILEEMKE